MAYISATKHQPDKVLFEKQVTIERTSSSLYANSLFVWFIYFSIFIYYTLIYLYSFDGRPTFNYSDN